MMRKRSKHGVFSINAAAVATFVGVTLVILYSAFVAFPFFQGPSVLLDPPRMSDGVVLLSGSTSRVSKLSINELEVPITDRGQFSVERAFPPGYTVVIIRASDRFGRSREETLTFVTQSHASQKETNINEKGDEDSISEVDIES